MLDMITQYAYLIFVPIIAIAGTIWYMNTHTIISTGPEGEMQGCLSVFISFVIAGVVIVTLVMQFFSWCVEFFLNHWKWFAGGIGILVLLGIWGSKDSEPPEEKSPKTQEPSTCAAGNNTEDKKDN